MVCLGFALCSYTVPYRCMDTRVGGFVCVGVWMGVWVGVYVPIFKHILTAYSHIMHTDMPARMHTHRNHTCSVCIEIHVQYLFAHA